MSEWLEAADWSRFQPAHTEVAMRQLMAAGIELIIPGSWHGDAWGQNGHCRGDLRRGRNVGLKTATYVVLDSPKGTTARGAVNRAYNICGDEWPHLSFVSLDIEVPGITVQEIAAGLDEVMRLGQRPVIYTAYWFWSEVFGNPQEFGHVPLWNAYYDADADIDFASASYGAWSVADVVGEQYMGTTNYAGSEMDRNTFRRSFIEKKEEDDMAKLLRFGIRRADGSLGWTAYTYVTDGYSLRHVTDADAAKELHDIGVWPDPAAAPLASREALEQLNGGPL